MASALPSLARIAGWASALRSSGEPLRWLIESRGLSPAVIESARIGWDRDRRCLVSPIYRDGELVAYKTRAPRSGAKILKPRGSGVWAWPLYPELDAPDGWTLLVAGELDALRLRTAGLPTVSVTGGAGHWRDEWAADLAGVSVGVCFDVGEEAQALRQVGTLRAAGVRSRMVDLRSLGMHHPKSDPSDYLNAGGDPRRPTRPGARSVAPP